MRDSLTLSLCLQLWGGGRGSLPRGWPRSCCWNLALYCFLEPLHWPPRLLLSFSAACGPENGSGEDQIRSLKSSFQPSPQLGHEAPPKPLIHFSSVGSVWHEKYLIQSTGKCFWKTFPWRENVCWWACRCLHPPILPALPMPHPPTQFSKDLLFSRLLGPHH